MHYYLARAVYTCMYEYDLIFKWCCLCGGTITMECLGMTMCFYGLKSIRLRESEVNDKQGGFHSTRNLTYLHTHKAFFHSLSTCGVERILSNFQNDSRARASRIISMDFPAAQVIVQQQQQRDNISNKNK